MPPRFPFEAARDLIGILRVLYANEVSTRHGSRARLAKIRSIATELQQATRMAEPHDPGTAPHDRAIAMAEAATLRIEDLIADIELSVTAHQDVGGLVRTAGLRVEGKWRVRAPTDREIKWACGKARG